MSSCRNNEKRWQKGCGIHQKNPDGFVNIQTPFDKVVAANVIHLLDEPMKALCELRRVCRNGGQLIIPTYINRTKGGKTSGFAKTVGKAGADFKRQFTFDSYKKFFADAGFKKSEYTFIDGKIPCALAVITIVKEV